MLATALLLMLVAAEPLAPAPLENPATWFSPDDYPPDAIRAEAMGMVGFALNIDATGAITSCLVTTTSGSPVLDAATCDLLTARGRFEPARDRRGRKVAGQYRSRIRWQLPSDKYPLKPWSTMLEMEISARGEMLSCTRRAQGPELDTELGACRAMERATRSERLALRSSPGIETLPVIFQNALSLDGAPLPTDYLAPGFQLTNIILIEFEIDAEGEVGGCRVQRAEGLLAGAGTRCESLSGFRFDVADTEAVKPFPRKGALLTASAVGKSVSNP